MMRGLFVSIFAVLILVPSLAIADGDILWDQMPNTSKDAVSVVDQSFPDFPDFSTFLVNDVTFDQDVSIHSVATYFTNGNLNWPQSGSGTGILNIYSSPPMASDDPTMGMIVSVDYQADASTITVTASGLNLELTAGTYWIGLTPELGFNSNGQEFHRSALGDVVGGETQARNPAGGFGIGTDWGNASTLFGAPNPYDSAMTITGKTLQSCEITTSFVNGTLTIDGSPCDDEIDAYAIPIGIVTFLNGQLDFFPNVTHLIVNGNDGNDIINVEKAGAVIFGGDGRDEIKIFGDGGVEIYGGEANDIIIGGLGDDYIEGGPGIDDISGRPGDDEIYGSDPNATDPSRDTIRGGQGRDTLHGGPRNDTILGGDGNDTIFGYAGNDDLSGAAGADEIHGDDGNDTITGGDGIDMLFGGTGNDDIGGGSGQDTIVGNGGVDILKGNEGADCLDGGDDNDMLFGGEGIDDLFGGGGDDDLFGGPGQDDIFGGPGNDVLFGENGNDVLNGGSGDDTLTGGAGNDELNGGSGNDTATDVGENGESGIENPA